MTATHARTKRSKVIPGGGPYPARVDGLEAIYGIRIRVSRGKPKGVSDVQYLRWRRLRSCGERLYLRERMSGEVDIESMNSALTRIAPKQCVTRLTRLYQNGQCRSGGRHCSIPIHAYEKMFVMNVQSEHTLMYFQRPTNSLKPMVPLRSVSCNANDQSAQVLSLGVDVRRLRRST